MTKLIPILSGRCLVVELPEGHHLYEFYNKWFDLESGIEIHLPPGNWRIIGMLNEVTEEQSATFVKLHATIKKYKDYLTSKEHPTNIFTKTALESLDSAILAEGYYLDENPMGGKPSVMDYAPYCLIEGGNTTSAMTDEDWESYHKALAEYKDSQSRVLDRSRCLLLGREGT